MKKMLAAAAGLAVAVATFATGETSTRVASPDWAMNATAIEACSGPMFCQCYFSGRPAGHLTEGHGDGHQGHGGSGALKHYGKANLVYRINKRHYGATSLDGAKFWWPPTSAPTSPTARWTGRSSTSTRR